MDVDPKFICPRPRNPRACSNCRSRKIRCLPSGKGSNGKTCRRCVKLGYTCSYLNGPQYRAQPEISPHQTLNHGSPQSDEDVVPGLFRDRPLPSGGVDQLMDFHRRVFQEQSHQDCSPDSATTPTPEPVGPSLPSGDTNINMREADKLLSLFRKGNAYFPFIHIPESTSAASMAVHQPFLLLAILTVSSSRTPRLQQRTDERFRRVMSERVILHGEKGLDYVQGLLVYIAWYPLYLRPLRNQIPQYLQIVWTMISDLDLDLNLEGSEGRNASLGCHALCSLMSSTGRRFDYSRARIETYLQGTPRLDRSDDLAMQYLRIQDLAGRVARYKVDVRDQAKIPGDSTDEEPSIPDTLEEVREKMASFTDELEDLYWALPSESRTRIPMRLTRQFIKVNISSLPLIVPNPAPYQIPLCTPVTINLAHATSHFSEIQSFLDLFLFIPPNEYIHFSVCEWSQLVMTIFLTSDLCFSQVPLHHLQDTIQRGRWVEFQGQTRAKMLIYLESLTHRMGALSVSSRLTYPDAFYMFKSVLGILMRTYAPVATCPLNFDTPTRIPEIQNENTRMRSSRCPILNGRIQETDFWRALERNGPVPGYSSHENTTNGGDMNGNSTGNGNGNGGLNMDDLVNHPQDWPSVFEEWVIDFNNLLE